MISVERLFRQHIDAHQASLRDVAASQMGNIQRLVEVALESLSGGGKIMFFGNGGSAADAQHLAAELVVQYARRRRPIAAIALGCETGLLTAAGNDLGFESIFSRQLEALARPHDLVVAISTSGRSPNVIAGLTVARGLNLQAAGFSAGDGGAMAGLADPLVLAPAGPVATIQEMHMILGHIFCGALEAAWGE